MGFGGSQEDPVENHWKMKQYLGVYMSIEQYLYFYRVPVQIFDYVYFCQHRSVSILGTIMHTNNDNDVISSSLCLLYFFQHYPNNHLLSSIMLFASAPSYSLLLCISRKLCFFQNLQQSPPPPPCRLHPHSDNKLWLLRLLHHPRPVRRL